jgi:hypothetical protein
LGLDEELAQADVAHAVHRSPRLFGIDRSTWTLPLLRSVIGWMAKYRFFSHIEQHYPEAHVISIALDNWPVHFHGYVRDNLARIHSKIRFLPLPTYAPWTNPIEKFWRQRSTGNSWTSIPMAVRKRSSATLWTCGSTSIVKNRLLCFLKLAYFPMATRSYRINLLMCIIAPLRTEESTSSPRPSQCSSFRLHSGKNALSIDLCFQHVTNPTRTA